MYCQSENYKKMNLHLCMIRCKTFMKISFGWKLLGKDWGIRISTKNETFYSPVIVLIYI